MMTSHPKESTTMGPLQERHQTSTLSRRSCLVALESRMTSRNRRRPAQRALFGVSHNDRHIERRRNFAFAENLLTIRVAEFKKKWNFDPVKMKPTNQIMSDSTDSFASPDKIPADKGVLTPRYEWRVINENREKKSLEETFCSLVPSCARSLRWSYLPAHSNVQNEPPTNENDRHSTFVQDSNIPSNAEISQSSCDSSNNSIEFNSSLDSQYENSHAENILDSSSEETTQESLPAKVSLESSPGGKPLESVKSANIENKESAQKSISVVTANKDNKSSGGCSTVVIDPTAQTGCIPTATQPKNTKQLKITDFACQRKRVRSESVLAAPDNPPAKRLRPLI